MPAHYPSDAQAQGMIESACLLYRHTLGQYEPADYVNQHSVAQLVLMHSLPGTWYGIYCRIKRRLPESCSAVNGYPSQVGHAVAKAYPGTPMQLCPQ